MPEAREIRELVTHDGRFHLDEVMSTAILRDLYPAAEILRTRDPLRVSPAPQRIIYDVGGSYDPDQLIFDHHQAGSPVRDNGISYSSFGLIWKHFGAAWLRQAGLTGLNDDQIARIHGRYENSIVQSVDEYDTGARGLDQAGFMRGLSMPSILGDMLPDFDDDNPDAMREAFDDAVDIAALTIRNRVRVMASKLRAEALVRIAVEAAGDGAILELPRGMPYHSVVDDMGADHLLYVVNPNDATWALSTIRGSSGSLDMRKALPAEWAGLRDAELAEVTGVADAIFAHRGLFMAVSASRDGIMELARQAVERVVEPSPDPAI